MYELPLFPLNTVLFPGTPIQLHIFEPRYKQMINDCVRERNPFGVVLIRHGMEALGPLAEPFSIGCSAQIIQVQSLENHRLYITAVGRERFRVLSIDRGSEPYLVGKVENYPLPQVGGKDLHESGEFLEVWVRRYLNDLKDAGKTDIDLEHLPGDPLLLAYMAAAVLQIPPIQKQKLLSLHDAPGLLHELRKIYRLEVPFLEAFLREKTPAESVFSLN